MSLATWIGLGVWLGVLGAPLVPTALPLWSSLAVAVAGWLVLWRRGSVALGLGLLLGVTAVQRLPEGPAVRGPVAIHGRVVGAPVGGTVDVAVWRLGVPHQGLAPASGRVRLAVDGRAPPPGTEVLAWGEGRPPTRPVLPGAPDLVAGAGAGRIRTEIRARSAQVVGREPTAPLPVPARHGGVLRALALGDKQLVEPEVIEVLRGTGTSHLLAISGFHVGVVAGVAGGSVALLLRAVAVFWQRGLDLRPAWVVGATAALGYAWAAGAPVSAQRAALLVALAALIRVCGARPDPVPLLASVGAALLVVDPAAATSPGFQLSFGAVFGLARLAAPLEGLRPRWWPSLLGWVWTSVAVTTAATVGTLPAAGWWFQAVAPASPVANLIGVPWTTFVLAPLAGAAVLAPAPLDAWAYQAGDVAVDLLLAALRPSVAAPLPIAWGTGGALALAVALVLHRRLAWAFALALVTAPPAGPPPGLRVTWPEIGQGSAALVEWPDGRTWLVDGGPPGSGVLHWLRRRGVRRIDVVVAAHGQTDHAGGLAPVVRELPVGELWVPLGSRGDPQLREVVLAALERGVPVVPGPDADLAGRERAMLPIENDRSIVLAPSWGGLAVLLPGDVGAAGEAALLPAIAALDARVVATALPHHGSRQGSTPPFVGVVAPPVAVAQAARFSRFKHPAPATLDRWARAGTRVWQTGRDGTVELTVLPDIVRVRTWRWDRGWRREADVRLQSVPWRSAGLSTLGAVGG